MFMILSCCLIGIDWVVEVVGQVLVEIFINVQGDELLFNFDDLCKLIDVVQVSLEVIINGYCGIVDEMMFCNLLVFKVVFCLDGCLFYMLWVVILMIK